MKTNAAAWQVALGCLGIVFCAGCTGSPPWGGWSHSPSPEQIQAALGRPETFIYFTQYEVYRGTATGQYVYQEDGKWVHRKSPPKDVHEATLYTTPAVRLVLGDVPEKQHKWVLQQHPHVLVASDAAPADPKPDAVVLASMP